MENNNPDYGVEIFDTEIEACLNMFCAQYQINDMKKEPQSVWSAALMYIKKMVFPDTKKLKSSNLISNGSKFPTTCNAYNYELVDHICDIYIYLCMINDKEVSINGFSYLTGIHRDIIKQWGRNERKLSDKGHYICKKLIESRQESLSSKLATGKQNPVGVIAILNHFYNWNSPYAADANRHAAALSAAELPRLNSLETVETAQLAEKKTDDEIGEINI